jgi:hypothetical protein
MDERDPSDRSLLVCDRKPPFDPPRRFGRHLGVVQHVPCNDEAVSRIEYLDDAVDSGIARGGNVLHKLRSCLPCRFERDIVEVRTGEFGFYEGGPNMFARRTDEEFVSKFGGDGDLPFTIWRDDGAGLPYRRNRRDP